MIKSPIKRERIDKQTQLEEVSYVDDSLPLELTASSCKDSLDVCKNPIQEVYVCQEDVAVISNLHWTESERHLWITSLFFGLALLHSSRTLLPVCSVAIAKEFNWNKSQMGAVLGSFFWGYILTQYACGWLADHIGGEQVATLGAIGWSSIVLLYPSLPYFQIYFNDLLFVMLLLRVLNGLFQGFFMPSVGSLMSTRVDLGKRGTTFTLLNAGAYFGTLLTGSVGSILLENYGWRSPFYILGILGFVWIFATRWCLLAARHHCSLSMALQCFIHPRSTVKILHQRHLHSSDLPTSKFYSQSRLNETKSIPWGKILYRKEFWAMMAGHYAYGHAHNILLSWLPTYFHDSFPQANGWVFNVVPWLVTIPSSLFGGILADRLINKGYSVTSVRKIMETLCLLGTATFLLLMPSVKGSYLLSLACMAIAVSFTGFHCGGIMLNPQDLVPEHGGAIFGLMNMCGALPGFLAVYIAGFILEQTKNWMIVFNQAAFVCIAGWILYLFYGSAEKIVI